MSKGVARGYKRTFIPKPEDALLPDDREHAPFGVYLRKLRSRAGIAQLTLAQRVGISAEFMRQLEFRESAYIRQRTATRQTILQIASALNLTPIEQDALLYKAGLAPVYNWMERYIRNTEEIFDGINGKVESSEPAQ